MLASAQGRSAREIAAMFAATERYGREVIHAFNDSGFAASSPNGRAADQQVRVGCP
ncbi:helix-turn-helix domain-containing protein [Amycolatopsis sp. NBRC 101858]|uniref:helix-turn-helix domain-containing protein n=1 Tax=Amycolatopsis sp. NBRC 101858 TaxID=3032200 RepID=UPI002555B648|nr:helix-turn-helix domain-containing protein [Amycolatopsis sp. NBRC 101858]